MSDDSRERMDDAALDALVAQVARMDAPDGFAVRVGAALDAGEAAAVPHTWLRPALAVAAMLLLAALWWWRQPVQMTPERPRQASVAPVAPVAPRAPVAPVAPVALNAPQAPNAPRAPVYIRVDHERAVAALDTVIAVQQKAIDPAAIATRTIDVQPAAEITPLRMDADRPDPGGEGDHR